MRAHAKDRLPLCLAPRACHQVHTLPSLRGFAGPLEPRYSEYLVFEGICVDEKGAPAVAAAAAAVAAVAEDRAAPVTSPPP